jgi:hypothetical protein
MKHLLLQRQYLTSDQKAKVIEDIIFSINVRFKGMCDYSSATYRALKILCITKVSYTSFQYLYGHFANDILSFNQLIDKIETRRNDNLNY